MRENLCNFKHQFGYNIEDLLEQAEEIGFLSPLCFGRDGRKHFIYITKGF